MRQASVSSVSYTRPPPSPGCHGALTPTLVPAKTSVATDVADGGLEWKRGGGEGGAPRSMAVHI